MKDSEPEDREVEMSESWVAKLEVSRAQVSDHYSQLLFSAKEWKEVAASYWRDQKGLDPGERDQADMTPMVNAYYDSLDAVVTLICPVVDRDEALQAVWALIKVSRPQWVMLTTDARMRTFAVTDAASADSEPVPHETLMTLTQWESGRSRVEQLPYVLRDDGTMVWEIADEDLTLVYDSAYPSKVKQEPDGYVLQSVRSMFEDPQRQRVKSALDQTPEEQRGRMDAYGASAACAALSARGWHQTVQTNNMDAIRLFQEVPGSLLVHSDEWVEMNEVADQVVAEGDGGAPEGPQGPRN